MSGVIDKNVVQLVFDTIGFQQNAETTLSTLDKLKEALNFDGAVRGLENLGGSVRDIGMDGLYEGVYKVQEGFNALDVVATRVIQNITDKVQNLATSLIKEVTVEPLKSGLEEYETQINSVQTILANTNDALIEKGLTTEHDRIEKINGVLDDLNQYADMTIYNFTEMTRNIGTFTAAGVDLDTAATSIKGIANLAAMSGSNSQQASTAMYQLSQAIASGSVKLQDWNSVVNAGMGGKLFQNELIDTAKAMGVVDENFAALTEGTITFRDSLSSGWISAEVLTNTLEKFTAGSEGYTKSQVEQMRELWRARGYSESQIESLTGSINQLSEEQEKNLRTKWAEKGFSDEQIDHILSMGTAATDAATKVKTFTQLIDTTKEALQSGWTQSWEYIIGDFEQAKMLWTEISDILNLYIGKSADARNNALKEWSEAAYSYNEAGELIRVADGQIVEGGKMVADEMGGRELVIQGVRNAFQGALEVGIQFGEAWDKYFLGKNPDDNIEDISLTGQKLKELSRAFYDATNAMKEVWSQRDEEGNAIGLLGQLTESFTKFATSMRTAYDGLKSVFSGLGNIFGSFTISDFFKIDTLDGAITGISAITKRIQDFGEAFNKHFGNDPEGLNKNGLVQFFNSLLSVLETNISTKLNLFTNMFDAFGSVIEHLIEPFGTFSQLLGKVGEKILQFTNAFEAMTWDENASKFEPFFKGLADGFNNFIDTLKNTVDFSGFSKFFNNLIESISSDKVDLFKVFENVFGGLVDIFKAFLAIASPVAAAFANIFSTSIGEALTFVREITDRFKAFTSSLIANEEVIRGVQTLFEGIFSVLKAIGEVVGNVLLASWDSLVSIFSKFLPDSSTLSENLNNMGTSLKGVADVIASLVSGENGVPKLSDLIAGITNKFIGFFGALKDVNLLDRFSELLNKIGDGIKHALGGTDDMTLFDTIIEKIKGFLEGIKRILSDENGNLDLVKVFEAGGIGVIIKKLVEMLSNLKKNAGNLSGVLGFINDIKEALEGLAEAFQDKFKAESIKAIATSILEIAGALFIVAMIDPTALGLAILTVKAMFVLIEELLLSLKGFSKTDTATLAAAAGAIQTLGNAVLMMAAAIAIIGNMEMANAIQGIIALGVMLQGLTWAIKELSTIEKDIPKVAAALIALAIAIDLLTIPVVVLGNMDLLNLAKGLIAVGLMITGLVIAADQLSNKAADMIQAGAGFVLMATGISILAGAVTKVAGLSWEDIGKGLAVFAVGLVGMVEAAKQVDYNNLEESLLALGGAMMMLGIAMNEFAIAGILMSAVEWEDLGKMGAVFAVALIGLGVASHFIDGKNLLMVAGAIALVATAFLELNAALALGTLLGPLMTSISMAIEGMSHSLESFAHSAARDAFLQFLKDAILFLPQLAVGLAQAIIELVVALGEGAAKIVGAVVKIGQAILQGIVTLLPELFNVVKTFIDQVIQLVIDEVPRIFEALTVFFDQLWGFLTGQIPNFFNFLTVWFTELFTFLQMSAPMLIQTIQLIIDTLLQAIIAEAPVIGETLLTLLHTLLDVIGTAIPEITQTLLELLTTLLGQLEEFVPQMADSALKILLGFLEAIGNNIQQITESALSIAIAFMQGITEKMPELVDTAFKMVISFINGLADAIRENHQALFDAVGNLITSIVEALIDGVTSLAGAIGEWFTGPNNILDAIGGFATDIFNAGADLVQGFIDGILSMPQKLWDSACSLANDAWNAITNTLDEHSPSRVTYGGGANFTQGFINGIRDLTGEAADQARILAETTLDAFDNEIDEPTLSPIVTPVIDASTIQNGINSVDSMLKTIPQTYGISANLEDKNSLGKQIYDLLNTPADYSDIINALNGVKTELAAYNNQLSRMQIVMDSGTLVGELTPAIDNALGMRQILVERGVY